MQYEWAINAADLIVRSDPEYTLSFTLIFAPILTDKQVEVEKGRIDGIGLVLWDMENHTYLSSERMCAIWEVLGQLLHYTPRLYYRKHGKRAWIRIPYWKKDAVWPIVDEKGVTDADEKTADEKVTDGKVADENVG